MSSFQQTRARLVGQLGAHVTFGLPEAHHRAQRVGEDRHASRIHDVHGRHEDSATVRRHLGHGVVGAADVHVGHPDRRHVRVHLRAQAGDGLAAQFAHRVTPGIGRTRREVPAEETSVEFLGLVQVRASQVHPGRDSVVVALDFHCASSSC